MEGVWAGVNPMGLRGRDRALPGRQVMVDEEHERHAQREAREPEYLDRRGHAARLFRGGIRKLAHGPYDAPADPPRQSTVRSNRRRIPSMPVLVKTAMLLVVSNVFMTFAWYAHLKELNHRPWVIAALVSWGVALLEYLFQVPANRIGYSVASVAHLKVLQEVITLSVFVPFAVFYLREPIKLDYLWAGLCLCGAVWFMFRGGLGAA